MKPVVFTEQYAVNSLSYVHTWHAHVHIINIMAYSYFYCCWLNSIKDCIYHELSFFKSPLAIMVRMCVAMLPMHLCE